MWPQNTLKKRQIKKKKKKKRARSFLKNKRVVTEVTYKRIFGNEAYETNRISETKKKKPPF